jgi:DNA-directed RNA polymerase specialized sigma24 family protein
MKDKWNPTQEDFDRFLAWLDPNRERAGIKYIEIHSKLIKFFTCRGCSEAEDLTDDTINRVMRRLPDIIDSYVGEPGRYAYGVARHVYDEYLSNRNHIIKKLTEYLRHLRRRVMGPLAEWSHQNERAYKCLEECLAKLSDEDRTLILQYHKDEKRTKIDHRKEMAEQEGLTPNALRIKMFRIKDRLFNCFAKCMKKSSGNMKYNE